MEEEPCEDALELLCNESSDVRLERRELGHARALIWAGVTGGLNASVALTRDAPGAGRRAICVSRPAALGQIRTGS